MSRRYLNYIFADAFNTNPPRYLRLLRLHEVRRPAKVRAKLSPKQRIVRNVAAPLTGDNDTWRVQYRVLPMVVQSVDSR
ncbi:hypothetical protein NB231_07582 [Nitrococcus mobilis Nb-231]|uniref:Uncharacterized protein n=1 Tax=Nitrococcus mobilis Nb-231 TaxID=314278 RepID=A4BTB1_9GAMM|nr:hypothetical protein NB231_07582 [Nitrococcus mobilis Nb-231]